MKVLMLKQALFHNRLWILFWIWRMIQLHLELGFSEMIKKTAMIAKLLNS